MLAAGSLALFAQCAERRSVGRAGPASETARSKPGNCFFAPSVTRSFSQPCLQTENFWARAE